MYDDNPIETEQVSPCFNPNIKPESPDVLEINGFPHDQTNTTHESDCTNEPNPWIPTNISEMGQITSNSNATDLLTLLQLPGCSFAPSSISFGKSTSPSSSSMGFLGVGDQFNPIPGFAMADHMMNDPFFNVNLNNTSQPSSSFREFMLQPLPSGYPAGNGNLSSMFGMQGLDFNNGVENMNIANNGYGIAGILQDGDLHNHHHHHNQMHGSNGFFEFNSGGNPCLGEGKEGKCPKNFVTERQRRLSFKDKYDDLKKLVPSPTKGDRASIVKDAIDYIMELKRTVAELKFRVQKKRITKERLKRVKSDQDKSGFNGGENDQEVKPEVDENLELRSSWLQRKWRDTEVDVRIVDDEVTIKLVQRKKMNCLMNVCRTLDELQLDLRHVAGGHVGDYYSYLFNSKICEGSSVYASAIANKLIEVVERQYASASVVLQPTTSF